MSSSFFDAVSARCKSIDSLLCVGLDPRAETASEAEKVCLDIISATSEYACCFKPNSAFFEAHGGPGFEALGRVIAASHEAGVPVILDAKRGDVGSTGKLYAKAAYETLGADCVTVSPFLGFDGLEPFVKPNKGLFVLCANSNPSAKSFQDDAMRTKIAASCSKGGEWDSKARGLLGLVVGATDIGALELVRSVNSTSWILAPGIGAQGGDLKRAVEAGIASDRDPRLIVPVSRGISDAKEGYAAAACRLRDDVNAVLRRGSAEEEGKKSSSVLKPCQTRFVSCALASGALTFGNFTLKSGRKSPYFFNAGLVNRGDHVEGLFEAYADTILSMKVEFDVVFGPAYKGIPLCAGVVAALARRGCNVGFAYNRKEAKSHGEKGVMVGAPVSGKRVLLVDDVISAGTAIREAVTILSANDARFVAAVVGLDRQEVTGGVDLPEPGQERVSAVAAAGLEFGVPVGAVVTLTDLLTYIEHHSSTLDIAQYAPAVRKYREDYGVVVVV